MSLTLLTTYKNMYQIVPKNKNSFAVYNTITNQLVKTFSVDGEIIGCPSVNGSTGIVSVRKNKANRSCVYDFARGMLQKTFNI